MRTYRQSLEFLFSLRGVGVKLGLDRIRAFTDALGFPQHSFKSVIVGGTNGKGSTVTLFSSILRESGYRTGRILSPHIADFGERISVDDKPIEHEFVVSFLEEWDVFILENEVSFFETVTAMALAYFREKNVDAAVLEVGMGGRLDASNVVDADLSIITGIALDHTKSLGDTPLAIASEKIAISRPGRILAAGMLEDDVRNFFRAYSNERNIKYVSLGVDAHVTDISMRTGITGFSYRGMDGNEQRYSTSLPGIHQAYNAGTVIMAAESADDDNVFDISGESIRKGLLKAFLPGRFQLVSENPPVIIDVAHNPDGSRVLVSSIENRFPELDFILIFGVKADKDYEEMLKYLSKVGNSMITVKPPVTSAREPSEIASAARGLFDDVMIIPQLDKAVEKAYSLLEKGENRGIIVTGSFFTVSASLPALKAKGCLIKGLSPGEDLHRMAV